jgi:hypothetical protein
MAVKSAGILCDFFNVLTKILEAFLQICEDSGMMIGRKRESWISLIFFIEDLELL